MTEIKLTKKQAFYLWRHCELDVPPGTMRKLWDVFGGEKSKLYKDYVKNYRKPLKG